MRGQALAIAAWAAAWAVAAAAQDQAPLRPLARPATLAIPAEPVLPAGAPEPSPAPPPPPTVGPETSLPLPRFVSLKTGEGNARRGPSLEHGIDWTFVRADMPLRVTAEHGHWRRVEDREGLGGWVHYSLLSGSRTVIVDQSMLPLRTGPAPDAPATALVEAGVVARLDACEPAWCRIDADGHRGWAPKGALWGVAPDEVID